VYSNLNPAQLPTASTLPTNKGSGSTRREKDREGEKEDLESGARAKAEEMEENEQDRKARLRIGAFGALRFILGISSHHIFVGYTNGFFLETSTKTTATDTSSDLLNLLKNPVLWSSLYYAAQCPFANSWDGESFGFAQPGVRKAAWALVGTLLKTWKGSYYGCVS
jgi:hypothetical protein